MDFLGLQFVPDANTSHLHILDSTAVYNPPELPTTIDNHEQFGSTLDLLLDAQILDVFESNPIVKILNKQGVVLLALEIDVSFSNLIATSELIVSTK